MQQLAATAGIVLDVAHRAVLDALKHAIDEAGALGPQAIVRLAMAYLAAPDHRGHSAYGMLVEHVNRALTNPGRNPRSAASYGAIGGLEDIAPAGLRLWWVKEGSATIVFQVRVELRHERPPVRFVLNVAKDTTAAADELRRAHADFVDFYRMEPRRDGALRSA
jgi:hypothetical protein